MVQAWVTGPGNLGVCSERLYSGAGGGREWLVESDMAIGTDTTYKEVDATLLLLSSAHIVGTPLFQGFSALPFRI